MLPSARFRDEPVRPRAPVRHVRRLLVPFNAPLILVLPGPEGDALDEAVTQLIRIGYERVLGYVEGGVDSWRGAGGETASYATAGADDLWRATTRGPAPQILDVRQDVEWRGMRIPGSQHIHVGDLPEHVDHVRPGNPIWTICESGHRAAISASLLQRAGLEARPVIGGGVSGWAAREYPVER